MEGSHWTEKEPLFPESDRWLFMRDLENWIYARLELWLPNHTPLFCNNTSTSTAL
jgi:hypothetical protein